MKTVIKITAITIITVLAALSCSDEVELTRRDFNEIRDVNAPKYVNFDYSDFVPSINSIGLTYVAPPNIPTETQKEMTITFPAGADILKKNIKTSDIMEFISMYTFDNTDEVSSKADDVDFEFVRRVRQTVDTDTEDVIIRLIEVPNKTFVVKIDATRYTFAGGLKLDIDGDNVAGEAVYDDVYIRITPGGSVTSIPSYKTPILTFSLTILAVPISPGSLNNLIEQEIRIADLSLGDYSSTDRKSRQKAVIEALMPKIKFQKYNPESKTWTDTGTIKSVDSNTSSEISGDWYLAVDITPQDGDIYRTYASGMKNLTTSDTFLDIKQKIEVSADGSLYGQDDPKYTYNTVISDPIMFTDQDPNKRIIQNVSPVDTSYPINISSDGNGKNVKLEIYFSSILAGGLSYWPEDNGNETFKKNFKLVYNNASHGGSITNLSLTSLEDLVFIPIKEVKYESHNPNNSIPVPGINKITITLDPSYQLSKERDRTISLLLAPGFKYGTDIIFFGDYSFIGAASFIDGTNFWKAYGQIGSLKL
jgi:hypothetical protein